MARRSGGSHKCVEEKRRMLPIYQHYTLSPGRTKSHHPEAKCIHCLKEFVCGSKQRLIRHLRKCNSISNPDQIIAETLNTLARNSATGQLNHSILEASNLLPSQISHIHHSTTQHLVGHAIQQQQHYHLNNSQPHHPNNNHSSSTSSSSSTTLTTANTNVISNNSGAINGSGINNVEGTINPDTSGSSLANNDTVVVAASSNGVTTAYNTLIPVKKTRRGRRPANQHATGSGIHVTTGLDGKTQFTPISQLPPGLVSGTPHLITSVHNGVARGPGYSNFSSTTSGTTTSAATTSLVQPVASLNSGHHIHVTPLKLNSEPIDKAYLKLVLTRNLPISLCDTKEFQNWVRTFANDYKPPSSINLIAQNLKQEAQSARQRISNILVKAPKKTVNLELHSWPDQLRGHLWYAIIAALDSRRFLISIKDILGQSHYSANSQIVGGNPALKNSHNAALKPLDQMMLVEFIDDCIKRVGSDRVNSLMFTRKVTDEFAIVSIARRALYTNHPSIVTHYCWWHFTNLLCSDVIEKDEEFSNVFKSSNQLLNFINKRPQLYLKLERFSPFAGAPGTLHLKKNDPRWYSHLICYLFDFIKNNHEAILKALEDYNTISEANQSISTQDNNNNDATKSTDNSQAVVVRHNNENKNSALDSTQSTQSEQNQYIATKSIITSPDYWRNLNAALVYLKPFKDIVALISTPIILSANNNVETTDHNQKSTPAISAYLPNYLSLSDYMNWFLNYGKSLLDSWRKSPDRYKYSLIGRYIRRFSASIEDFKLLFAAYLLNPKYRCAYVTQKAKDSAIEEILNIASEFMPEESDGHTIFDQWKLFLIREEPYDMIYDESRYSALDWWMSLPCAESIRRVALRILRLKAFSSPRPESLFSQLYFYEDEIGTYVEKSSFEDLATLRYFYDHEDRMLNAYNTPSANVTNPTASNGVIDRTQIGQVHNEHLHDTNDTSSYLPSSGLSSVSPEMSDRHLGIEGLSINESSDLRIFTDAVDSYVDATKDFNSLDSTNPSLSLSDLIGFNEFAAYIDFEELGVQVIEEPIEKKRRKWTAQEILSKCQSSHNSSINSNSANSKQSDK